jgi:hypothetical protein
MAIYLASFVSLEDALSSPNNPQVDLIAVVAHVGLWDCQTLFPNSFREIALRDNRYMLIFLKKIIFLMSLCFV